MKLFSFLLALAIIINIKCDYSIDSLLDYLQEKGLYDIIVEIKVYFGNDVAIDVCKSFVETNHCEEVVRIYMNPSRPKYIPYFVNNSSDIIDNEPEEPLNKEEKFSDIINEYYEILFNALGQNGIDELNKIKKKLN